MPNPTCHTKSLFTTAEDLKCCIKISVPVMESADKNKPPLRIHQLATELHLDGGFFHAVLFSLTAAGLNLLYWRKYVHHGHIC